MTTRTRFQTLYRLPGVAPTAEAMFEVLNAAKLDEIGADFHVTHIAGMPALVVGGVFDTELATWVPDASITTGLELRYGDRRSALLVLLAVDGVVYALGYGAGHHLIPGDLKDPRFGLRFAIRRLDPAQVQDFVRLLPGRQGRTDATLVPGGMPIWTLGAEEHAEVVRRIGGKLRDLEVTFSRRDGRAVRVEGAVGLSMRFGVRPEDLVRDIREIARVCETEPPDPDLEFVEHIQPVADKRLAARLDAAFDDLLGRRAEAAQRVNVVVPTTCLPYFRDARRFKIAIGSVTYRERVTLEAGDFLERAFVQRPGQRVAALRKGRVRMYADERCTEELDDAPAVQWLEAEVSLGSARYCMLDGDWYEIGAEYVAAQRRKITGLFRAVPSLDLPACDPLRTEDFYNSHVSDVRPGFVYLHRSCVRNPLNRRGSVEICDLLGPDDELVLVKFASGAESLSHLFAQGLVAVKTLLSSPEACQEFAAQVAVARGGRVIAPDFRPRKLVFVILLKDGRPLTPDTLFPFAQVTLAHTATVLRSYGVEIEVIGVRPDLELSQVA